MLTIQGKHSSAVVYTDNLEPTAQAQIKTLCDQPFTKGSVIRIMPDVHAGKGCTIGTTMTVDKYIVPNMVGVDIGCGMLALRLDTGRINCPKLDSLIRSDVPAGFNVRNKPHKFSNTFEINLHCSDKVDLHRAKLSIGTLGGGNHFIEVAKSDAGAHYLIIHSGSRNLGNQVAKYYQDVAYNKLGGKSQKDVPYELAYLEGADMQDYLDDMTVTQAYAKTNREAIADVIMSGMRWKDADSPISTIHNYVARRDDGAWVLRKGAVSAEDGELFILPINMRDGSLICKGKRNREWNFSAPHGAGRLMSRTQAKNSFTVSSFKKQMEGIFTTSVDKDTLDECPMAYKPIEEILKHIEPTASVIEAIKPVYNFKAPEAGRKKGR